jgi:hypothetical protein
VKTPTLGGGGGKQMFVQNESWACDSELINMYT